jgi:hypothetical protein
MFFKFLPLRGDEPAEKPGNKGSGKAAEGKKVGFKAGLAA